MQAEGEVAAAHALADLEAELATLRDQRKEMADAAADAARRAEPAAAPAEDFMGGMMRVAGQIDALTREADEADDEGEVWRAWRCKEIRLRRQGVAGREKGGGAGVEGRQVRIPRAELGPRTPRYALHSLPTQRLSANCSAIPCECCAVPCECCAVPCECCAIPCKCCAVPCECCAVPC
eukprot:84168-Chlamydomonas_euryale.AAC.4